jgi:predicted nucleic acid-binding protein
LKLVVDASVALKWILSPILEAHAKGAGDLLGSIGIGTVELFAPVHWFAEIVAVVARQEPDRLEDTLELLHALNVQVIDGRELLGYAAKLSHMLDHHLFDTLYHAVAIDQAATLITADARYFEKARPLGKIELLGMTAWTQVPKA